MGQSLDYIFYEFITEFEHLLQVESPVYLKNEDPINFKLSNENYNLNELCNRFIDCSFKNALLKDNLFRIDCLDYFEYIHLLHQTITSNTIFNENAALQTFKLKLEEYDLYDKLRLRKKYIPGNFPKQNLTSKINYAIKAIKEIENHLLSIHQIVHLIGCKDYEYKYNHIHYPNLPKKISLFWLVFLALYKERHYLMSLSPSYLKLCDNSDEYPYIRDEESTIKLKKILSTYFLEVTGYNNESDTDKFIWYCFPPYYGYKITPYEYYYPKNRLNTHHPKYLQKLIKGKSSEEISNIVIDLVKILYFAFKNDWFTVTSGKKKKLSNKTLFTKSISKAFSSIKGFSESNLRTQIIPHIINEDDMIIDDWTVLYSNTSTLLLNNNFCEN